MMTRVRNQLVIGVVTTIVLLLLAGLLHTGILIVTNAPIA